MHNLKTIVHINLKVVLPGCSLFPLHFLLLEAIHLDLFLHSYSIIICIITLSDHSNSGKNTNEIPFMTKTSRFFLAFLFYAYF